MEHPMILRLILVFYIAAMLTSTASPQIPNAIPSAAKVKIESATPNARLEDRYEALSCALVRITSDEGSGTGFFIDNAGTIVTAAHLVMQTDFSLEGRAIRVQMSAQHNLKATTSDKVTRPIELSTSKADAEMAASDLAVIKTSFTPRCHLEIGDTKGLRIGSHLIAIGYPGFDSPSASLYEGFLGSRYPHAPIPIGSAGLQSAISTYEVMRIQMPIATGASGTPVITDDNRVVGIITEETAIWTKELADFLALAKQPKLSVGMTISFSNGQVIEPLKLLSQLILIVHELETPGAGLAVPTYYLKLATDAGRPASNSSP